MARTIESLRYRWSADLDRGQGTEGVGGFARLATLQIEVSALNEESPEPELRLTCDIASFGEPLTEDARWASAARVAPFGQSRLSALALRSSPVEASGRVVDWTSGTSASIDAVALSGGLPAALLRRQSRFDQLADLWWDVAWDLFRDEIDAERGPSAPRHVQGADGCCDGRCATDRWAHGRNRQRTRAAFVAVAASRGGSSRHRSLGPDDTSRGRAEPRPARLRRLQARFAGSWKVPTGSPRRLWSARRVSRGNCCEI